MSRGDGAQDPPQYGMERCRDGGKVVVAVSPRET
jgi:hypothetical protein